MEPLIRNLNKLGESSKGNVGMLTAPKGFRITNMMFADDCLIFAKATGTAARNIAKVLYNFAQPSGQKINYHKLSFYFSNNTNHHVRSDIINILTIQHKTTIGRYLGIHNIIFQKDQVNTKELIIKIKNKLAGWKANTLSKAGRLTLIKANLLGIPNHTMSCFKCHEKITKTIDRESRKFFWGKDCKLVPMAWDRVCSLKENGSLGFRKNDHF